MGIVDQAWHLSILEECMRLMMMTLSAVVLLMTTAFAADEKPRCDECGMFYDKSPTQVAVVVTEGDAEYDHLFESLGCYTNYMTANYADNNEAAVGNMQVLDYGTFGSRQPVMLDATKATYLYGTNAIKGSMPPFIAAFATTKAALNATDTMGGEVLAYAEVMARLAGDDAATGCDNCSGCAGCPKATESDGKDEPVYVCSCTGGCCDDIEADAPGECPKCGMELKKKEA